MKTRTTIARGVALLDTVMPGWEKRVDLDTLDVSSPCNCICGQIVSRRVKPYHRFTKGLQALGLTSWEAWKYGFASPTGSYRRLTDEWSRVIRAKRDGEAITS